MNLPAKWTGMLIVPLIAVLSIAIGCRGSQSESLTPMPTEIGAEALLGAGLVAQQEGRLDDAAGLYKEVLAHDPGNKYASFNLALIHQTSGNSREAEQHYRAALAIDSDYVPALYNLAIVRTAAGFLTDAVDLYRHAIAVEPENASAHLNLGFLLRQLGLQSEGDASLARAVSLNPALAARIPVENTGPIVGVTSAAQ